MAGIPGNIDASTESGTQLASHFNDLKTAFASQNKGTSRDANLVQGGIWVDSTNIGSGTAIVKFYDGTDDITLFTIDISANTVVLPNATNSLSINKTSADTIAPILNFVKSRIASSGQVNTGDSLGEIIVGGKDNGGATRNAMQIKVAALENFTSTANGAEFILNLIKATENAYTEILRIKNGLIGVGTTTPATLLHLKGTTGLTVETPNTDNATASKIIMRKKRSTTNGKVLNADGLGSIAFHSTDQNGTEITDAVSIETVATQDHTNTAQGSGCNFYVKKTGASSKTLQMQINDTVTIVPQLTLTAGQIVFPSSQNASSNANTLDDYEEGTFTVTIIGTTTAGSGTYSTQVASYEKLGRQVTVRFQINWTAHTGTGNIRVAGLPFTSSATANSQVAAAIGYWQNLAITAGSIPMMYVITNSTQMDIVQMASGGGVMSSVPMDTSAQIMVSCTYYVD